MKVELWLTRDEGDSNYELWAAEPRWNKIGKIWDGADWIHWLSPKSVKRVFKINWKGGKRSIRKLTVII